MVRPQAPAVETLAYLDGAWRAEGDAVAAEEPLQVSLDGRPLSVLMRTPGSDVELVLGLLWGEGVITSLGQVERVLISAEAGEEESGIPVVAGLVESNQVDVRLRSAPARSVERSFLSSSACGVCGATTVEALARDFPTLPPGPVVEAGALLRMGSSLRAGQGLFERTGGLHAAALFSPGGELFTLREDVGRHNAVDKVVGRALLDRELPLHGRVLIVSGRGGYELAQKAVAAGIPVMAAVGAPSSLAVAVAKRFEMTLAGFLREGRFNLYSCPGRVEGAT